MNPFHKEDKMIPLKTRSKKKKPFWYARTRHRNILIEFGEGREYTVTAQQYQHMIRAFSGQVVKLGPTHGNPKPGTVEAWVNHNITGTGIASYLGPILVHEKRAEWVVDAPVLTLRFCRD